MSDTACGALVQGLYILVFWCFSTCLILLWKTPFPANAPKIVSGYPIVGAIQAIINRERFCHHNKTASPTGNYSYYLGRHRIVGLSGLQGRKTFFGSQNLDLEEGVSLFFPLASAAEKADDPSVDTHTSYFRATLRAALLRTQGLAYTTPPIEACVTMTLDSIAAKGLIEPISEFKGFITQSTMAVMGIDEATSSPGLSKKVAELINAVEGSFSSANSVIPCLLNPLLIPAIIPLGRLYFLIWQIIRNLRQQQQQKQHPRPNGMLHDMMERGRSTRAMVKALLITTFAAHGNAPIVTSWLLIHLAADAYWMDQVRKEVNQVVARHRKGGDTAEQVLRSLDSRTWEHEFPLLSACFLESVRFVALLGLIRKNTSTADVPIGDTGEVIPPGAYAVSLESFPNFLQKLLTIHQTYDILEVTQDPEVYLDPQRWDPQRFLPDRAEHLKGPLAFTCFGAGRRKCIGRRLANIQALMIVARLITTFDIILCDEHGSPLDQAPAPRTDALHFAAPPQPPVRLRCTPQL